MDNPVLESLKQQIMEEVGGEDGLENTPNRTMLMLNQKYGIIPPQLTGAEKHLIIREARKRGKH